MSKIDFITVRQAEELIQSELQDYGTEEIAFESASGKILAENLTADRDLPPFNRATMDGIAINFNAIKRDNYSFKVKATQAAGIKPIAIQSEEECIEIMTGAALHNTLDTIIRYEDIEIKNEIAHINNKDIKKNQSIHPKGKDKKEGDNLAFVGQTINPTLIGLAASIGKITVKVKKIPQVIIITTGDEMVEVDTKPSAFQIRRSNGYTIRAALQQYKVEADTKHLNDDFDLIKETLSKYIQEYDVIIICGGVSKGKYDYIPKVLQTLSVNKIFHKVKQRPGKPFWFGKHKNNTLFFALPGNPVSAFMCLQRYFIPWLKSSLNDKKQNPCYAVLSKEIYFATSLQYFAQVQLSYNIQGMLTAKPIEGNGSGDFVNLTQCDAFMELPADKKHFKEGEAYRIWKYNLNF